MLVLDFESRADWREWLAKNHGLETLVWLVFYKKAKGIPGLLYEEAVEEALCFGWVDSLIKKLDANRYLRKFTPRNPGSLWSDINKTRAEKMIAAGRMSPPGMALVREARQSGEWDRVRKPGPRWVEESRELAEALLDHPRAAAHFRALAPSYRRHYNLWVSTAKKPRTRMRRVREAIQKLERGERLGLK